MRKVRKQATPRLQFGERRKLKREEAVAVRAEERPEEAEARTNGTETRRIETRR